jgi:uncharacterized membrane protein YedE/YeeE
MRTQAGALLAGTLFGLGLAVSQMVNPEKVLAFLNVSGDWDPSLALVLAAALAVSAIVYRLAVRRDAPLLADRFRLPSRTDLDAKLIGGAAIFGAGWGLAGYCPGPAISAIALGSWEPFVFIAGLALGSLIQSLIGRRSA